VVRHAGFKQKDIEHGVRGSNHPHPDPRCHGIGHKPDTEVPETKKASPANVDKALIYNDNSWWLWVGSKIARSLLIG
jgi:hypothetical protein